MFLLGCTTLYPQTTFYFEDFEGTSINWGYTSPSGSNNNYWVWGSGTAGATIGAATHQGTGSLQVWRYSSGWWTDYSTTKSASRYATEIFDFSSIPANATITMNMWLLVEGESSGSNYYDYFRVLVNGVEQGNKYTHSGGWVEISYDLSLYAGNGVDIDLHWVNDNSLGLQPGARIDDIEIIYTVPPEQPGDDPFNAIALIFNDPYEVYDNKLMSNTTTEVLPTCANYVNKDMWFTFVVPLDGTEAEVDTQPGTLSDSGMEWYRGSIGSLVSIECDDDDGDGFMSWIHRTDLTPGETIYVRIWEYGGSSGPGGFSIRAYGPTSLPIELLFFEGENMDNKNLLKWATASENNSSHFELKRSKNGTKWENINTVTAMGNSTEYIEYITLDNDYQPIINYYQLIQYDFDGRFEVFDPIAIDNRIPNRRIVKYVNLMGQEVNSLITKGLIIEIYEDGTTKKVIY